MLRLKRTRTFSISLLLSQCSPDVLGGQPGSRFEIVVVPHLEVGVHRDCLVKEQRFGRVAPIDTLNGIVGVPSHEPGKEIGSLEGLARPIVREDRIDDLDAGEILRAKSSKLVHRGQDRPVGLAALLVERELDRPFPALGVNVSDDLNDQGMEGKEVRPQRVVSVAFFSREPVIERFEVKGRDDGELGMAFDDLDRFHQQRIPPQLPKMVIRTGQPPRLRHMQPFESVSVEKKLPFGVESRPSRLTG